MTQMQFSPETTLLAAGWAVWCFFHSLLAAESIDSRVKRLMGERARWSRLAYNLFAVVTIAPLVYFEKALAASYWEWGPLEPLRMALFWGALAVFIWVMSHYDLSGFSGIGGDADADELVTTGALAIVRHPLYALAFVLLWTRPLSNTATVTSAVLTIYIFIGTALEERRLARQFGKAYLDYRRETSAYFPWRWIARKIPGAAR